MKIAGLDHVQLAMPAGGEALARSFYAGILGLQEIRKPAPLAARGGCWFDNGVIQIHVGAEENFIPARKAHPAILLADFDEARAELQQAGIEVRDDDSVEGVRRFYADDPFGNRLEFIARGDGFSEENFERAPV